MTTPTGKMMWGQPGFYDAVDDRAVISAVTKFRIGLARPPLVEAGAGLNIIIRAPWAGVADCSDGTSGVVGSNLDHTVQANPGPATGSRRDVIWCDTHADSAEWSLRVITEAASAGLPGIALATITVPANASSAAAMDIVPADAQLERRIKAYAWKGEDNNPYTATGPGQAAAMRLFCDPVVLEPGQWYRVHFDMTCASIISPTNGTILEGRIGVGMRTTAQGPGQGQLVRGAVVCWSRIFVPVYAECEYIFRHPKRDPAITRVFDGRMWSNGNAQILPGGYNELGNTAQLSVEDIGS
jgi:hypothetical protein